MAADPGLVAVAAARSCLGTPYRFGGSQCDSPNGPGGIDCSGLTMRAWAAAGVKLPHSSAAQAAMLGAHPSPQSSWRPGDLIFYFHPVHHVALYVGNGKVISASSGRVHYEAWNANPYIGTGRPTGGTGGETPPPLGGAPVAMGCLLTLLLAPLGYRWLWGRR